MPGFNQQQLSYRARNANAAAVLIGDQIIAFAQTVTHSFDTGAETFYGIGSAKPQEIQQLRMGPEVTIDNFALTTVGNTLIQGGVNFASIIANNQFLITLGDLGSNGQFTVAYSYVGCTARNFSETVAANRPITDAIAFNAMDVLDNTGQSILNGTNAFQIPSPVAAPVNGGLGISVAASL